MLVQIRMGFSNLNFDYYSKVYINFNVNRISAPACLGLLDNARVSNHKNYRVLDKDIHPRYTPLMVTLLNMNVSNDLPNNSLLHAQVKDLKPGLDTQNPSKASSPASINLWHKYFPGRHFLPLKSTWHGSVFWFLLSIEWWVVDVLVGRSLLMAQFGPAQSSLHTHSALSVVSWNKRILNEYHGIQWNGSK